PAGSADCRFPTGRCPAPPDRRRRAPEGGLRQPGSTGWPAARTRPPRRQRLWSSSRARAFSSSHDIFDHSGSGVWRSRKAFVRAASSAADSRRRPPSGASRATGLPWRVMMMGSPDASTSSSRLDRLVLASRTPTDRITTSRSELWSEYQAPAYLSHPIAGSRRKPGSTNPLLHRVVVDWDARDLEVATGDDGEAPFEEEAAGGLAGF